MGLWGIFVKSVHFERPEDVLLPLTRNPFGYFQYSERATETTGLENYHAAFLYSDDPIVAMVIGYLQFDNQILAWHLLPLQMFVRKVNILTRDRKAETPAPQFRKNFTSSPIFFPFSNLFTKPHLWPPCWFTN